MRIAILDTYYPSVLSRWEFRTSETYESELQRLLEFSFGTADFFSRNLRAIGHECIDIIGNARQLQSMWARKHGLSEHASLISIALAQIAVFKPDAVFCQDLSFFTPNDLDALGSKCLLAAQLSCPMPSPKNVVKFRLIATSFPHYVPRLKAMGVKPVYLPLAFDPIVLDRTKECERDLDAVFVGGVGAPSHWEKGTQTLEAIAQNIPSFRWWGYGCETLPNGSALRAKYQGPAFGTDMYQILRRAKIVVNRHGEVAEGWANNMRLFEASGCGACVLTEDAPNLHALFPLGAPDRYKSAHDAVNKIERLLSQEDERSAIANAVSLQTSLLHTYETRMSALSAELEAVL